MENVITLNKSPIGSRFINQLAQANDIACFYAFQFEQNKLFLGPNKQHVDRLTPEVFPKNIYSKRINISIERLHRLNQISKIASVKMNIAVCLEYLLSYCIEIENFFYEHRDENRPYESKLEIEEKIKKTLNNYDSKSEINEIVKTIGFFRHTRNVIAHANIEPTPQFINYKRNHSHHLDSYWNSNDINISNFSFSDFSPTNIEFEESLSMINLIRVTLLKLDNIFSKSLDITLLAREIQEEVLNRNPTKRGVYTVLSRKVFRLLCREYGAAADEAVAIEYLNDALK